jgi:hypothetical protein
MVLDFLRMRRKSITQEERRGLPINLVIPKETT